MKIRVVAFYTENTPYEEEAFKLAETLDIFWPTYTLYSIPDQGSWLQNCAMKPIIIKDIMKDFENKNDIFYVDVDARFQRFPKLFDYIFSSDIAVAYLGKELLSGSIFLRNCPEVMKIINTWINEQSNDQLDQRVLQSVIETPRDNIVVKKLPSQYCTIYDIMSYVEDPVIVHYQASRKYRQDYGKEQPLVYNGNSDLFEQLKNVT